MGALGQFKDSVTLVNRTSRILTVRFDGEDTYLQPGENPGFPLVAVPYAKKQNILMGSRHPDVPMQFIALVGVKGSKDDVSPIEDATLKHADTKLEVFDRDGEFSGEPMKKVTPLRKSKFRPDEAAVSLPDMDGAQG